MIIAPKTSFQIGGNISSPAPSSPITGKVTLNITKVSLLTAEVISGEFLFDISGLNEGKYNSEIKFEGNDVYEPVSGTFTLDIVKSTTAIGNINMYPKVGGIASNVTIIADILACPFKESSCSAPNQPASGLDVAFLVGKTSMGSVKSENGKAVFSFRPKSVGLSIGTYDIGISVSGGEKFKNSSVSLPGALKVTLSPIEVEMKELQETRVGNVMKISGIVTSYKNPIPAQLVVKINEVEKRITAKKDGSFEIQFTPTLTGSYAVLVEVLATAEYEGMSTSTIIDVLPDESVIKVKLQDKVNVGETFRISGNLSDRNLKGFPGEVFIRIEGPHQIDEGSVLTNKYGNFNFDVTLLDEGLYTINIIFNGDEVHGFVSNVYYIEAVNAGRQL